MRLFRIAIAITALTVAASAFPRVYTFTGVTLNDGGTVSGTFTFDADAGTPCSTHASPCGVYSNINVTTSTGSARTGATYTAVCGTNVPSCTGVSPDSTEVLLLTSTAANQAGLPAVAIFFTTIGGVPPAGLSDTTGPIDVSGAVGIGQEAGCSNAVCFGPAPPARFFNAGSVTIVTTVPLLSSGGAGDAGRDAGLRRRVEPAEGSMEGRRGSVCHGAVLFGYRGGAEGDAVSNHGAPDPGEPLASSDVRAGPWSRPSPDKCV